MLAAAIRSNATLIVTANLADFPPDVLSRHSIEALAPDDFVLQLVRQDLDAVIEVVERRRPTCAIRRWAPPTSRRHAGRWSDSHRRRVAVRDNRLTRSTVRLSPAPAPLLPPSIGEPSHRPLNLCSAGSGCRGRRLQMSPTTDSILDSMAMTSRTGASGRQSFSNDSRRMTLIGVGTGVGMSPRRGLQPAASWCSQPAGAGSRAFPPLRYIENT